MESGAESLRSRSAAVFGNRYLVEVVAAAVASASGPEDVLTVRMLAQRAGLADSVVRPVVKRLVEAQLLQPLPQERPRGPNYHRIRRDDGIWDTLAHTCALLQDTNQSQ